MIYRQSLIFLSDFIIMVLGTFKIALGYTSCNYFDYYMYNYSQIGLESVYLPILVIFQSLHVTGKVRSLIVLVNTWKLIFFVVDIS